MHGKSSKALTFVLKLRKSTDSTTHITGPGCCDLLKLIDEDRLDWFLNFSLFKRIDYSGP